MVIKAIIFDCFGVLTTDTWNAFLDQLPSGTDISAAREVHRAYDAGLISQQACAEQLREITGQNFTELEDITTGVVKNTALLEYIAGLKDTYKIGMLSNIGNNWVRDSFLSGHEQRLFDDMVFSYEVGMVKPDHRMFVLAAERLNVLPEETILVDDKERYCTAAEEIGMQAVVYNNFNQMKQDLSAILPVQ